MRPAADSGPARVTGIRCSTPQGLELVRPQELLLGPPLLGNVAEDQDDPEDRAALVPDGRGAVIATKQSKR
jgi:hypothetical protein